MGELQEIIDELRIAKGYALVTFEDDANKEAEKK
jgi:hypothetical protein